MRGAAMLGAAAAAAGATVVMDRGVFRLWLCQCPLLPARCQEVAGATQQPPECFFSPGQLV